MNKIIIGLIIIAVIVLGGYLLFKNYSAPVTNANLSSLTNQETSASQASPITGQNVIVYTNTGYSPNSINIKAGDTVTFKNESSQPMWTASAMHPTHTQYPTTGGCIGSTFDACQGVQPGSTWLFKFDLVGTWKYHNHLNPTHFGTIIVE